MLVLPAQSLGDELSASSAEPMRRLGYGGGRHHEVRLREMMARADMLRDVLSNASLAYSPKNEYLRRKLIDDGKDYEISVCRPLGVAFVHVYKAAGTTAKNLMELGCPEPRHHYSCCGCEEEPRPVYCHTLEEGELWKENVTATFAIIRDPIERFRSGIFELARRDNPWMRTCIALATRRNKSVAEVTIDDLHFRKRTEVEFLADPHLMEQTNFLSDGMRPPHALDYIAKVGPYFKDDLAALAHKLFGLSHRVVDSLGRFRDAHNASYGKDKIYIHDQLLDSKTLTKIREYYEVDYAWLDLQATLGPRWPR